MDDLKAFYDKIENPIDNKNKWNNQWRKIFQLKMNITK